MHIDYKGMLPATKDCDHNHVKWETTEPRGQSYVLVTVDCQDCPAKVSDARVEKV